MANYYKGLTIKLDADSSKLTTELRKARSEASGTTKEMKQLDKALKIDPGNIKLLTQQQEALKTKISASTKELELLKTAEEQIGKEGMSTEAWNKLQRDILNCETELEAYNGKLAKVQAQLDAASSSAGQFGDRMSKAGDSMKDAGDKLEKVGGKVSSFGDSYTQKVTAPIIAAGAATVAAAVDIDSALTSVKKTVDGTEEQYQDLKQAAIEYSQTNAVSADQMLELDALGAQLGFTIDELQLFGEVASGLDIATDMNAEEGATEMAQFANITRMAHEDIERYGSAIVNIGNNMATTESKVSSMAQRIAAAGTQTKMSQADILGWAGAMSSLGIEAEAGGTAFSTTISTIDAAVAKGGEGLQTFAKIAGMSAQEFADKWKSNSTEAVQALLSGVDGAENMTIALEEMGVTGIRQSDVLKRLAGNTDLVSQALKTSNDGWAQNTALQNEVDNRNSSLASKFEILKNRVIAVAEQVGEPLANAMLEALDAAEPLIKVVTDGANAFSKMSKEEQQSIIKTVAMVAALGPLLSVAGRVTSAVGGMVDGIGGAAKSLGTFIEGLGDAEKKAKMTGSMVTGLKGGLVGLGVAAAGVVAGFLIHKWTEYQKKIEETEKASKSFKDMESEVYKQLGKSKDATGKAGDGLKNYQGNINDTIGKIDELRKAQADANDDFINSFTDFAVDESMLAGYVGTIQQLANQDLPLTAEKQAELTLAVEGYNDITGDSIEIINLQRGELSKSTSDIIANTDAWLAQAEIEVYQDRIKEAIKERITAEENLASAQDQLKKAQEYQNYVMEHAAEYGEAYAGVLAQATGEVARCEGAVKEAEGALKNCNDAIKDGTDKVKDIVFQQQIAAGTTDGWKAKIESFSDTTKQKLEAAGWNTDELAKKFVAAGISTQMMQSMSDESFTQMYNECNGDVDKMIAKLKEYDQQQIAKKKAELDSSEIDAAISKLGRLGAELKKPLQGKAMMTIGTGVLNAAGGIIPKHADGGILNQPTLTGVGWVGEAGAEAIIPLSNARYVAPFARAVAQQMQAISNSSNSKSVQIVLNGAVLNDDAAMQDAALTLLEQIQRKAGRNRG